MRRLSIILLFIIGATDIVKVQASDSIVFYNGYEVLHRQLIVKFKSTGKLKAAPPGSANFIGEVLSGIGAESVSQVFPASKPPKCSNGSDLSSIMRLRLDGKLELGAALDILSAQDWVEYAQPEFVHMVLGAPTDPMLDKQYFHNNVRSFQSWANSDADSSLIIAIVDTGVDYTHPELAPRLARNWADMPTGRDDDNDGYIDNHIGWDFGSGNSDPMPETSDHGTMVAGVAVAQHSNSAGGAGVAQAARFMPVKVASSSGWLVRTWEGVVYAANMGCQIINCSWGTTFPEPLGQDVVNYATFNCGALVVAAAGNNNTQEEFYPASFRHVLGVAGTVETDVKWLPGNSQSQQGSSWGYRVGICAPAANYYSTARGNKYQFIYGGTSMAAPIVSGAAAQVLSAFPQLGPLAVAEQLRSHADNIDTVPGNERYAGMLGAGRLNMENATRAIDKPGIRLAGYNILGQAQAKPGDTIHLSISLANYLADAENLETSIEFGSHLIRPLSGSYIFSRIASGDTVSTEGFPLSFVLSETLPYDFNAICRINYRCSHYSSHEFIAIAANPSHSLIDNGLFSLKVQANGKLAKMPGIFRQEQALSPYLGVELNEGGLLVAEAANLLASSVYGRKDFSLKQAAAHCSSDTSDYCVRSSYTSQLLGLEIEQTVFAWQAKPYIAIEYAIKNTSSFPKLSMAASSYFDFYAGSPWRNKQAYIGNKKISVIYSAQPGSGAAGAFALTGTNTLIYQAILGGGSGGIDSNTSDASLFRCMATEQILSSESALGSNQAFFVSSFPVDLGPGKIYRHTVGVVFADNENNIPFLAEELAQKFIGQPAAAVPETVNTPSFLFSKGKLFFSGHVDLLEIYCLTGRLRGVYKVNSGMADISGIEPGIYVISAKSSQAVWSGTVCVTEN
jgi:serine protease